MARQTENNEWDSPQAKRLTECMVCEAMLPDAADGLLSEVEQTAFDKHLATCTQCSQELEEAQRGAAWLQMLKGSSPEPSPLLLSKILAQTTGAESASSPVMRDEAAHKLATPVSSSTQGSPLQMIPDGTIGPRVSVPAQRESVMAFVGRKLVDIFSIQKATMHFQPRLAMTAAMAFFSVALTLNMTGIKLGSLKTSNLRPSALRRSVADTSASAVRSFQNMRVVYQFESKLEDIRDTSSMNQRTAPAEPATPQDNGSDNKDKQHGAGQDGTGPEHSGQNPHGHSALEFPLARRNATEEGV